MKQLLFPTGANKNCNSNKRNCIWKFISTIENNNRKRKCIKKITKRDNFFSNLPSIVKVASNLKTAIMHKSMFKSIKKTSINLNFLSSNIISKKFLKQTFFNNTEVTYHKNHSLVLSNKQSLDSFESNDLNFTLDMCLNNTDSLSNISSINFETVSPPFKSKSFIDSSTRSSLRYSKVLPKLKSKSHNYFPSKQDKENCTSKIHVASLFNTFDQTRKSQTISRNLISANSPAYLRESDKFVNLNLVTHLTTQPVDHAKFEREYFSHVLQSSLSCKNLIQAFHAYQKCFIRNKMIPLLSSNKETHFVTIKCELPNATSKNFDTLNTYMCCFKDYRSTSPMFEVLLNEAKCVTNLCSEAGPCFYLSTASLVLEFQCFHNDVYNYDFWMSLLSGLGVQLINPKDLFKIPSTASVGEGSFAKVYKAKHSLSQKTVVIKRIAKSKIQTTSENQVSAVHIEIDVLRHIKHPNIVQFITAFEDELAYHIVLELIPGGTINEWLRVNRKMTETQAKKAIKRILYILKALSSYNIVHRDLKPENLMLENRNDPTTIKLIDFGLAAYVNSSRMAMNCGSPGFVAPEIINNHPYGKKVDMFSVGVLLYTFLSGKPPFHSDGDTASKTLHKNKSCRVSFEDKIWKTISQEAKELLVLMLSKNPTNRICVQDALKHPWLQLDETSYDCNITKPICCYCSCQSPDCNSLSHYKTPQKFSPLVTQVLLLNENLGHNLCTCKISTTEKLQSLVP